MSKNEFQHVRRGEPLVIPAGAYNAMLDAAQAHRNRKITLAPHGNGFDSLFIHVVNETGQKLQRFDVVGLEEPLETKNTDIFVNKY
jgi:NAD(P)H-hydrate repair Nnr-like enzyme with NAD(P)H-hydrate dehydratase domain